MKTVRLVLGIIAFFLIYIFVMLPNLIINKKHYEKLGD